jgi:hypothetical protein
MEKVKGASAPFEPSWPSGPRVIKIYMSEGRQDLKDCKSFSRRLEVLKDGTSFKSEIYFRLFLKEKKIRNGKKN